MTRTSITRAPLLLVAMASLAAAQHHESGLLPWEQLKQEGKLLAGEIQPIKGQMPPPLRVSNIDQDPTRYPLLILTQMHPTANSFALQGEVRYENVKGPAFLEMWTVLPNGSRYFTRTLADQGPLQKIQGSSPWRPFALPFDLRAESPSFVTIEVNAFMPGPGIIDISPLRLVNLSTEPSTGRAVWWSDQTGRLYGICGGVIGVTFGLLSFLAQKRHSRSLHTLLFWLALTVAAVAAVVGILAVISSQPFRVWYPPLLIAALFFVLFPVNYYRQRRHYRDVELRKIQAMDT